MAFFETEFPRKGLSFQRVGGIGFNTSVIPVQSGQEQRNRAWANPRREYSGSLILTSELSTPLNIAIYNDVEKFLMMVGGQGDGFRFYDELDCQATNEAMVLVAGAVWQLQKTYALNGRTLVRTITKPITSSVKDYQGNALTNSVTIVSGGTLVSVDHTTGQVTLSGVSGTPHASFNYHIPVRLTSDKFEPQIEQSGPAARLIKWNSVGLIEVLAPNY
jgi:uncharacterized protein (TIGR02217 family)